MIRTSFKKHYFTIKRVVFKALTLIIGENMGEPVPELLKHSQTYIKLK